MEGLLLQRLKHHGLTERDVRRTVSDEHLEVISRTCCAGEQWKSLPAHLGLGTILATDIDGSLRGHRAKRLEFFQEWKKVKGHNATYKQLITALLKIDCGENADKVCTLLTHEGAHPLTPPSALSGSQAPPTGSLGPPRETHSVTAHIITPAVIACIIVALGVMLYTGTIDGVLASMEGRTGESDDGDLLGKTGGAGASDDAIVNVKSVSGGAGGAGVKDGPGGPGGTGIDAGGHGVTNYGSVDGGAGGHGGGGEEGSHGGVGGAGGTAIDSGVGAADDSGGRGTVNHGTVMGGRGGSGGPGAEGGAGGIAVHQRTKGVVNYGTIIGGAGGSGGEGGGAGGTGIRYSGSEGIVNHGNILSSGTGIHVTGHTTGGIVVNGAVIAGLGEGQEMLQKLCQLKRKEKSAVSDTLIGEVVGLDAASACPEPEPREPD